MAELSELVHNLPRELFDEIFALAFTPNSTAAVNINKEYRPPVQLQVTSGARRDFAKLYYSSPAGFSFASTPKDNPLLATWLESLPLPHRHMIERLEVLSNDQDLVASPIVGLADVACHLEDIRDWFKIKAVELKSNDVVRVFAYCPSMYKRLWLSLEDSVLDGLRDSGDEVALRVQEMVEKNFYAELEPMGETFENTWVEDPLPLPHYEDGDMSHVADRPD